MMIEMRGESDALIEANLDLPGVVSAALIKKYNFPPRLWDDVHSAAGLALVLAARKFNGQSDPRVYLYWKMRYLVIDEIRLVLQGRKGSQKSEHARRTMSLNRHATGKDGDSNESEAVDFIEDVRAQLDFDKMGDDEFVREFIDGLRDDREREIAIRLANGDTMRQIGDRFGITESRVSQIVSTIKHRTKEDTVEEPEGRVLLEWEEPELPRRSSVLVSWR